MQTFTLTHKELQEDLLVSFMSNKPMLILGAIGIGKSQAVRHASKEYAEKINREFVEYSSIPNHERHKMATDINHSIANKFIMVDIRSAMCDPSDFKGLPNLSSSYVNWLPDIIFRISSRPDFAGVIFFDEVNQALPAVQSALYQVILDNTAGSTKLSNGCLRVAAGNRAKDKSNVNNMSKALMQRFMNVELATPTAEEWIENFARPNSLYQSVIGYLQYKPIHINQDIDGIKEQRSFANPRNWERMAIQLDILDSIHTNKNERYFNQLDRLADANLGGEVAATFSAYMRIHGSIDIYELLKEPSKFKELPIDRRFFALDLVAIEYKKQGKKMIEQIGEVLQQLDTDIAVVMYKNLMGVNKLFQSHIMDSKSGGKWALESMKYFVN